MTANLKHRARELAALHRYASDILASKGMRLERRYRQHRKTSCYEHSIDVACMSVRLARGLHLNEKSLVRGALLHDYFLYDWHEKDRSHRLHGFTHAGRALQNAERDFHLDDIQRDIIATHMFPMNPKPPRYRESVIVTIADKLCAIRELLHAMLGG